MSAALLASYDDTLTSLESAIDSADAGDDVHLNAYLLEPGDSSLRVLSSLHGAAERGATVHLAVDWTAGSHLCRWWEQTRSLIADAEALARRTPNFEVSRKRVPDHAKWLVVQRPDSCGDGYTERPCLGFLGGINLGDRFRGWRDFMVRLEGCHAVDALLRAARGEVPAPPQPLYEVQLGFAANWPPTRSFGIEPTLAALAELPGLTRLRVAMAYLDRRGASLLAPVLERGATLDLLLPAKPNVYSESNRMALDWLSRRDPSHGDHFHVHLHPSMVHAKAFLAEDAAGPRLACLGSANLKQRSFDHFAELNLITTEPQLVQALALALDDLWAEASPSPAQIAYWPFRAWVEELLG